MVYKVCCFVYFVEGVDFYFFFFNIDGGSFENENNRNGIS